MPKPAKKKSTDPKAKAGGGERKKKPAAKAASPQKATAAGAKAKGASPAATPKLRSLKTLEAVRALPIWRKARRSRAKSPPVPEGALMIGAALRGTGYIQEDDPADAEFPMGAVAGAVVGDPRTKSQVWDLPSHLLNQGSTNSCVGHACSHFILAAPRMGTSIDAIAVWRRAQELDEFPGNEGTNSGTSVRAGFKALREMGLIESDYHWASGADDVLRFLLNRGPVVIGSKWYPGMGSPSNGVLNRTGNPGNLGHAYLLFGFSGDQDSFLVANSWGTTWGIDGMGFLPFQTLDQLLTEGGVACSAVQI